MPLSSDRDVKYFVGGEVIDVPMDDNVTIYKALVGVNRATGYARPLVAGDAFAGLAYRQAASTGPNDSAGSVSVKVHQTLDVVHALTGVAAADAGRAVYASDDGTLTLTPTGASFAGRVVSSEGTNLARVRLMPAYSHAPAAMPIIALADQSVTLTTDQLNRVATIANTAARTITLPAAAQARAGAWLQVVKTSAAAFAVTLDPNAAETVDGGATLATIDAQYDCAMLLCTGSEWIVLNRDIS